MMDEEGKILTLKEALAEPQLTHRDMKLALEPMPNFKSTPGNKNDVPLSFRASWELNSRPRRIALLMDDCQEEYRPYATGILPNLVKLTTAFRSSQEKLNQEPYMPCIVWSSWFRRFEDGICNAMDRWYGPRGLNLDNYQNALYIAQGQDGMNTLKEIQPTKKEIDDGWFYFSKHLDMFWAFQPGSDKSYLDEKLKTLGIDTIVVCGLWTDECIMSTAFAGLSRGYDVVVVGDAVGTATANGDVALTVMNGTCSKVLTTDEVCFYMENEFFLGEVGAVKGTSHPDGRKE